MVDAETLSHEAVLGFDHVQIPVMRKLRAQPIAWFARLAVTDVVREDDEVARGIDEPSGGEEDTCKFWPDELRTASARPVHDQDGVADDAGAVAFGLSQRPVVNPEFRKNLT